MPTLYNEMKLVTDNTNIYQCLIIYFIVVSFDSDNFVFGFKSSKMPILH